MHASPNWRLISLQSVSILASGAMNSSTGRTGMFELFDVTRLPVAQGGPEFGLHEQPHSVIAVVSSHVGTGTVAVGDLGGHLDNLIELESGSLLEHPPERFPAVQGPVKYVAQNLGGRVLDLVGEPGHQVGKVPCPKIPLCAPVKPLRRA